jgi:hypothetical protein
MKSSITQVQICVEEEVKITPRDGRKHLVGLVFTSHSGAALKHQMKRYADWLEYGPRSTLCIEIPASRKKECSFRAVVWGSSAKQMARAMGEEFELSSAHSLSARKNQTIWLAFSPVTAGLGAATELLRSVAQEDTLSRYSILDELSKGRGPGKRMALLKFHVLVYDWLLTLVSFPERNVLGLGAGTRNGVAALVQNLGSFKNLALAFMKDDEKERGDKLVVVECFAPLEVVKDSVCAQLSQEHVRQVLVLGPASTVLVLAGRESLRQVVQICKNAQIRLTMMEDADLLWCPSHKTSPLANHVNVLAASSHIMDVGLGQSFLTSESLKSLWMGWPTACGFKHLGKEDFIIELGPSSSMRSVSLLMKKSCQKVQSLNIFQKRRLNSDGFLQFLSTLTQETSLEPRSKGALDCKMIYLTGSSLGAEELVDQPLIEIVETTAGGVWHRGLLVEVLKKRNVAMRVLEESWRALVMFHPILRCVLIKGEDERPTIGVYPPLIASRWAGISCLVVEEFDSSVFPRFALNTTVNGAVRVAMEWGNFSEAMWRQLIWDWQKLVAGVEPAEILSGVEETLMTFQLEQLEPVAEEEDLEWLRVSDSCEGLAARSRLEVLNVLKEICMGQVACSFSQQGLVLLDGWELLESRRTMEDGGCQMIFSICFDLSTIDLDFDARYFTLDSQAKILSLICQKLNCFEAESCSPLHELIRGDGMFLASSLAEGQVSTEEVRARGMKLAKILTKDLKLQTGACIGVVLEDSVDFAVCMVAASLGRLRLVRLGADATKADGEKFELKALCTDRKRLDFVQKLGVGCVALIIAGLGRIDAEEESVEAADDDGLSVPFVLIHEAGSLFLSQLDLFELAHKVVRGLSLTARDRLSCFQTDALHLAVFALAGCYFDESNPTCAIVSRPQHWTRTCPSIRVVALIRGRAEEEADERVQKYFPNCISFLWISLE